MITFCLPSQPSSSSPSSIVSNLGQSLKPSQTCSLYMTCPLEHSNCAGVAVLKLVVLDPVVVDASFVITALVIAFVLDVAVDILVVINDDVVCNVLVVVPADIVVTAILIVVDVVVIIFCDIVSIFVVNDDGVVNVVPVVMVNFVVEGCDGAVIFAVNVVAIVITVR